MTGEHVPPKRLFRTLFGLIWSVSHAHSCHSYCLSWIVTKEPSLPPPLRTYSVALRHGSISSAKRRGRAEGCLSFWEYWCDQRSWSLQPGSAWGRQSWSRFLNPQTTCWPSLHWPKHLRWVRLWEFPRELVRLWIPAAAETRGKKEYYKPHFCIFRLKDYYFLCCWTSIIRLFTSKKQQQHAIAGQVCCPKVDLVVLEYKPIKKHPHVAGQQINTRGWFTQNISFRFQKCLYQQQRIIKLKTNFNK